jgi:hypothetical protein
MSEFHKKTTTYIYDVVDHINPYTDKHLRNCYTIGFLCSFIAMLSNEDSRNLVKFKLAAAQKHQNQS